MAKSDDTDMEAEIGYWSTESRLARLDRCRKYLYGELIITTTVNDAIRTSLEEARDRAYIADQDEMLPSVFAPGDDEPEEGDGPEAVD